MRCHHSGIVHRQSVSHHCSEYLRECAVDNVCWHVLQVGSVQECLHLLPCALSGNNRRTGTGDPVRHPVQHGQRQSDRLIRFSRGNVCRPRSPKLLLVAGGYKGPHTSPMHIMAWGLVHKGFVLGGFALQGRRHLVQFSQQGLRHTISKLGEVLANGQHFLFPLSGINR